MSADRRAAVNIEIGNVHIGQVLVNGCGAAEPINLDALAETPWHRPTVVDGEVISTRALPSWRGPLDADSRGVYPTALRGGVVNDPAQVAAIRQRIETAQRRESQGWWRRCGWFR